MTIFDVLNVAGGVALFLYGMNIMGSGLEKLAGSKLENILKSMTSSTIKAVVLGATITGLIQSSGATTVIVIGLVNSGIMKLSQAIGIIMGANIGTTVTGQIIRLSDLSGDSLLLKLLTPKSFAPVLAFAGAILFVFFKKPKQRNIGQILLGLGILFIGMFTIEASVVGLRESPTFIHLFASLENPILGILAGILVTVALQSSSASVGILQALSITGMVTWSSAIPIILGQNIGTCSTPLLASVGASKGAKQSALVHLYFNVIGTLLFMAGLYSAEYLFGLSFWNNIMNKGDIANFHTLFNVVVTIAFLPFAGVLAKLAQMTVKNTHQDEPILDIPVLDERLLTSSALAIQQSRSALEAMAAAVKTNYIEAMSLLSNYNEEKVNLIGQRESVVDRLEVSLNNYLIKITAKNLSKPENKVVSHLIYLVTQFERIGDYAVNIMERSGEVFDKNISFSVMAKNELGVLVDAVIEVLELSISAFKENNPQIASRVEPLEETIDIMCDTLHEQHISRLKQGQCSTESGVVFLEILSDIERISDHCSNVAINVIGTNTTGEFDSHRLKKELHSGNTKSYNELLNHYKEKYFDKLVNS